MALNAAIQFDWRGIRNYAANDPVTALDLSTGFTNSDTTNCLVEYTILDEDKNALTTAEA